MQKNTVFPLSDEQTALADKIRNETSSGKYLFVSFKFTDTLTVSPFSEFGDLFAFMEEDFSKVYKGKKNFTQLRTIAQDRAERNFGGKVTIDKIYDIFRKLSKIPHEDSNRLMERERELFVEFTFAREFGKSIYETAVKTKKKIIVVADTIYHTKDIEKILKKCGYTYKAIVHPAENDISRNDHEAVFDMVIEKSGVSAERILHIGGNVAADVETPIIKGSKALIVAPPVPMMIKSGQLRGWIQAELVYDYDKTDYSALHCAFGLYAAYGFSVPKSKTFRSDFCGSAFMLGFMVLGALSLAKDFTPSGEVQTALLDALEKSPECMKGKKAFLSLFERHLGKYGETAGYKGCELPFIFLAEHGSSADMEMMKEYMSETSAEKWKSDRTEPKTAVVYGRKAKQNAMSQLADRMFPPGTKVRNITENMLDKIKAVPHR